MPVCPGEISGARRRIDFGWSGPPDPREEVPQTVHFGVSGEACRLSRMAMLCGWVILGEPLVPRGAAEW